MSNEFLLHASQVGVCITPTKSELGEQAQKYCYKWLKYRELGTDRTPILTLKYLTKGIENEEQSIQEYGALNGLFLEKNKVTSVSNGLIGTPDVVDGDTIYDFKNSYSVESYPLYVGKINKVYYWQLQAYMLLFEKVKSKLVYCLTNSSENLVANEINSQIYKYASENGLAKFEVHKDVVSEIEYKVKREMLFDDIPIEKRYLEYEVERNEKDIEKIGIIIEQMKLFIDSLK